MNQSRIKRVVLAVAICIVIILLLLWYASALGNILSAGTRTQMQEFARQNALTVRTEMESQITSLAEISERIADLEEPLRPPLASEAENLSVIDVKRAVELLKEILPRYSFKRMGIAVPNGTAYTTDGYEMDLSKREYFTQSMQGKAGISERLTDYIGGAPIIVFSAPVYVEGRVEAVLFATYSVDILCGILDVSLFEKGSYSYIVNQEGSIVVNSASAPYIDYGSVYDFLRR